MTYTPRGVYWKNKINKIILIQKDKLIKRLKIVEGQVRGLREMIEKGSYCIDIITQSSAIKQGLSNVEDALLEGHLSHCVVRQVKSGQSKKAINEVLKVYKLKRK